MKIRKLPPQRWQALIAECSGRIGSLLDLLQGRFSSGVMEVLARREHGLFPAPAEIEFSCSCPDWAAMCKHVAAENFLDAAGGDRLVLTAAHPRICLWSETGTLELLEQAAETTPAAAAAEHRSDEISQTA